MTGLAIHGNGSRIKREGECVMANPDITKSFIQHYSGKIREHGPNALGVDWGFQDKADIRHDQMLQLLRTAATGGIPDLLDVGCGYGALLDRAKQRGISLNYSGIDVVAEMTAHGKQLHPEADFVTGDFLETKIGRKYDYLICNGILTLKLATSIMDMDAYAKSLIRKMYEHCNIGICFNVMSNAVNFQDQKLFYKSPVEMLAFCLSELSKKVRIDHSYPLYEFTTYVYRD